MKDIYLWIYMSWLHVTTKGEISHYIYDMDRDFVLPQNEKTVNREESIIYSSEGKPVRNVEC